MVLISSLRTAEFVTAIATHAAVLIFSFVAYRRTKLWPFTFWIAADFIGILLASSSYIVSNSRPLSEADYTIYQVSYRVAYIVDSFLRAIGTVVLIQYFLVKFRFGPPSNNAND